jgi:hypothetical protein
MCLSFSVFISSLTICVCVLADSSATPYTAHSAIAQICNLYQVVLHPPEAKNNYLNHRRAAGGRNQLKLLDGEQPVDAQYWSASPAGKKKDGRNRRLRQASAESDDAGGSGAIRSLTPTEDSAPTSCACCFVLRCGWRCGTEKYEDASRSRQTLAKTTAHYSYPKDRKVIIHLRPFSLFPS